MAGKRYDVACGCSGVALIALLMLTGYINKVSAQCVTLDHWTCAQLFPQVLCTDTQCRFSPRTYNFVCLIDGTTQWAPNGGGTDFCGQGATGAMACVNGGGRPPTDCGSTTTCKGCSANAQGVQVCQPVTPLTEFSCQGDSYTGGPCPPPS